MVYNPFKSGKSKGEGAQSGTGLGQLRPEAGPSGTQQQALVVAPGQSLTAVQESNTSTSAEEIIPNRTFQHEPTEGEYGLKPVHDGPNATADIIFVHGLTGNRETTWTRKKGQNVCFWPGALLSDDVQDVRIMSWGYDADVIKKGPFHVVSNNTVEQHAEALCRDLANARTGSEATRPIIFIVHSLGGLVTKRALLYSAACGTTNTAHIKAISENTHGIIFMGTPHQGSAHAQWGGMLASLLGYVKQDNTAIVQGLEKEAPHLAQLQQDFAQFLENKKEIKKPIDIFCFFEELPVPVLGTIVPSLSAVIAGYPSLGLHANHMDITKFGSDESPGYIRVLAEIQRLVRGARKKITDGPEQAKEETRAPSAVHGTTTITNHGNVADGGTALVGVNTFSGSGYQIGGGTRHLKSTAP